MTKDTATTPAPQKRLVNVNVGVLGHVDSGKTNLVRALSTQLSTAALDKHPQSQQRGITLDLGFSAFRLPPLADADLEIQVTLVDCPGHASLFKTILGGARIIDMVLLVVDVQKGLQPQTIESLLVAELAVKHHVVVALNKIDLVPESVRDARIHTMQNEIRRFLDAHFPSFRGQSVPIVPVAAAPSAAVATPGGADDTGGAGQSPSSLGISALVQSIRSHLYVPARDRKGPFSLAIDHCFAIQGNGTILTGTVLSGSVNVNDAIEIPSLQVVKKVKSIQMFKQNVQSAVQGDRVGIRVNGLDASLVERGMAITPHSMAYVHQVVVPVHQIAFFQGNCKSSGKFHATIGHTTVVAVATFFARVGKPSTASGALAHTFHPSDLYEHIAQVDALASSSSSAAAGRDGRESLQEQAERPEFFALLQFDQPILCQPSALVVCSRLDLDPKKFLCRLAFHGRVQAVVTASATASEALSAADSTLLQTKSASHGALYGHVTVPIQDLRIGKIKSREGVVDKVALNSSRHGGSDGGNSRREVIARDMFSKDVDWQVYANVMVLFETSRCLGQILGPFGKAGKFRIALIEDATRSSLPEPIVGERVVLRFIKLMVLKTPTPKGRGGTGKTAASDSSKSKASGNLLQVADVLYPEAFLPRPAPSVLPESRSNLVPAAAAHEKLQVDDAGGRSNAAPLEKSLALPRGRIERLKGETTADGRNPFVIVSGLFTTEQEAAAAAGKRIVCFASPQAPHDEGSVLKEEQGEVEKPFGKAGKVRVVFTENGGTLAQVGDEVVLLAETS